ncbi:MAG: glycosyltransferase family 4 protein [Bacteroidales bacterium]|nr:glycosyltransferase family 4 protein [Bacteroidales bacterium]
MRILFLTDNFPPEVNAPATRTFEHCSEWTKLGHEVTVITCAPNFPDGKVFAGYRNKRSGENVNGISIIRVKTYITANEGFAKRILDYLSFAIASFFAGLRINTDVIIGTSPQFFTAVSARWLSFFKQKPWVMEVRDLWPESIVSVGALKESALLHFLSWIEKSLYQSARLIITVTHTFKTRITARGIDASKIRVVPNGANVKLFIPREKNITLVNRLGLQQKFVFGFIGTMGMAHKLDFIINAAKKITDPSLHFLLIGSGAERKNLESLIEKEQVTNVSLYGLIPKNEVPEYLSVTDCALINLRKSETFKTVIPSKIFECAAMGKPILLGVDGEAREIIERYEAGLFFEPEDENDFLQKVQSMKTDRQRYKTMVEGGLRLAREYDRANLAGEMIGHIKDIL